MIKSGIIKIGRSLLLGIILAGCGLTTPGHAIASPVLPRAYICNYSDDSVSVIDVATNNVIDTVYGFYGPWSVAAKPDGTEVYIANNNSNTVSVIDTATNTKTDLNVGLYPQAMTMGTNGLQLYVVAGNYLYTIDTSTKTVSAPVDLGFSPYDITSSGSKIYMSSEADNTVKVFDTTTNGYSNPPITVGSSPQAITTNPDGSKVFVANSLPFNGTYSISVIDTFSNIVIAEPSVESIPTGITVSPNGTLIYVSLAIPQAEGKVTVLDTLNNYFASPSINVGIDPMGVDVSPDGRYIYALNSGSNNVSVIDTSTNDYVTTPVGVGLSPGSLGNFIVNLPPAQFEFSSPGFAVAEKGNNAVITVIRTYGIDGSASVSYTTADGTATVAELDYTATSGELIFAPGEITKTFSIPISNDGISEGSETLNLSLINPTGAILGARNTATLTISESSFAYITNNGSNTVSVIDTSTNLVATTVKVGLGPEGVAVTPDGTLVYIINGGSSNISVLNGLNNTLIDTVSAGQEPSGIVVSPDGYRVYVTNYGGYVTVLNTSTNTVIDTIYDVGYMPYEIAISPDGTRAYVKDLEYSAVFVIVIDPLNYSVSEVNVGSGNSGIAVSPDGAWVYVSDDYNKTVTPISTVDNTAQPPITVGNNPGGIAVRPDGRMVYVTNYGDNSVSVINTSDKSVTTLPVGISPSGIAVSPDGSKVYVVNSGDNSVTVLDALTNEFIDTVYVGQTPISFGNFIGPGNVNAPSWSWSDIYPLWDSYLGQYGVTLNWDTAAAMDDIGITGYRIYRDDLSVPTLIADVSGSTYSYNITGLSPDTMYSYHIEAGNAAGMWSDGGPGIAVTTLQPDYYPPVVNSTSPVDGSIDVLTNPTISIEFDMPINAYELYSDITITDANHNLVTFDPNIIDNNLTQTPSSILTITPSSSLAYDTNYTVDIPYGAIASTSGTMFGGTSFSFTTEQGPDTVTPYVYFTRPAQNETLTNGVIDVVFNESIVAGQNFSGITLMTGSTAVYYTYSMPPGNTLTLIPSPGLAPNTTYTVTIPSGAVQDVAGNVYSGPYTFSFTTLPASVVETTPPTISFTTPFDGETGVSGNSSIDIVFSEDITVANPSSITLKSGGTVVGYNYVVSGGILTLDPIVNLAYGTTYTVTIPSGAVQDVTGNVYSGTSFTFTTVAAPLVDTVPPNISNIHLVSSPTGVLVNSPFIMEFNENITEGTGFSSITLKSGSNVVNYTYSIVNNILTFTPTAALAHATAYTLTFPANGVTDLAGNNLNIVNQNTFTFTTNLFSNLYLEEAISLALNQQAFTITDLTKLTELNLTGFAISDLTGIELATNLQVLYLDHNSIINLAPLTNLTKLQRLYLSNNSITDLGPLANLSGLKTLVLGGNQLSDLTPLTGLTQLQELWLNNNRGLLNLNKLSSLTNLRVLGLQAQLYPITDISALAGLTKLKSLYLNNNQISNLTPLANLTNLQGLYLSYNLISDLAPLLTNSQKGGLGLGNYLDLRYNSLDLTTGSQASKDIQIINNAGIFVAG